MISQGRTGLVVNLKPSIELEASEELREEVTLWLTTGQLRDRTANLQQA